SLVDSGEAGSGMGTPGSTLVWCGSTGFVGTESNSTVPFAAYRDPANLMGTGWFSSANFRR
ncbi:MAG TPA: hypothetical protein V6C65_28695, partial [Allocoleopsis sp.]